MPDKPSTPSDSKQGKQPQPYKNPRNIVIWVIALCLVGFFLGSQFLSMSQSSVTDTLDTGVYDEVVPVENEAAFRMAREIAKKEGILVGISSGAAAYAAIELAKLPEYQGKTIAAILPDGGDRYYSTPLFME